MQYWHDIGELASSSILDFRQHGEHILRSENLRGRLSNVFLAEPVPGEWGDTRRDLPKRAMQMLMMILESQSGFMITDTGLQRGSRAGHPEVQQAVETGRIKFLVGTLPDGGRKVAILLLE